MLTIIIPCFNPDFKLLDTLRSLDEQSHSLFKIILVDDCSTNLFFSDMAFSENILVYRAPHNVGPGVARNIGVQHTDTKYLMFLDSDDLLHKNCVSKMLATIDRLDVDAVGCGYKKFQDSRPSNRPDKAATPCQISRINFLSKRGFAPWGVIFKTDFIINFPFSKLRNAEDVFFSVSYLHAMKHIYYLDEKLVFYRTDVQGSLTSDKDSHAVAVGQAMQMLNQEFDSSFIRKINLLLITQFYRHVAVYSLSRSLPVQMISIKEISSTLYLNLGCIFLNIRTRIRFFYNLNRIINFLYKRIRK